MDGKFMNSLEDLEQLFNSRMAEYEEKLTKASTGSGSVAVNVASISSEFSNFKMFVWQALSKLKSQIELLGVGFDRHETFMRRKVLLLHGVPEKPDEKLHEVVTDILNCKLRLSDLQETHNTLNVCHRLGSSRQKTRPILVRFFKVEHRQLMWDAKKLLKGTGITISEFLTQPRHQTFLAARKHFSMKNCWTTEGRIVILCPDKTRRKIETMGELNELVVRFPTGIVETAVIDPGSPRDVQEVSKAQRKTRRRNC